VAVFLFVEGIAGHHRLHWAGRLGVADSAGPCEVL
jgi:hypothetical protein